MGHIRPLDGIRALAVLAVVGTHSRLPFFHGGGFGVDMFFALSGFLITSLLLREVERTATIAKGAFYVRRALRLFPPLAVMIVLTVIIDQIAASGGHHAAEAVPAVVFYVGNWLVAHNGQALGFFGQTWSLAIEEQFYLVWPLLLLIPAVRRNLVVALPVFVLAMVFGRIVAFHALGSPVMVWTPFRADELALGAWLAAWIHAGRPIPRWIASWQLSAVAMLGILVMFGPTLPTWLSASGSTDVAAAATVVIIAHLTTGERSPVSRFLGWTPLVGVGRVSYGIYLYHYAILLWLFSMGWSYQHVILVAWPLIALTVVASWIFVEQPALRLKDRIGLARHGDPATAVAPALEEVTEANRTPQEQGAPQSAS
jgi:peptidoglycan/LPS O-acetylase OafA/YrhL